MVERGRLLGVDRRCCLLLLLLLLLLHATHQMIRIAAGHPLPEHLLTGTTVPFQGALPACALLCASLAVR